MSTRGQVTTAGIAFEALEIWKQDPTEENRTAFTEAAAIFMIEYRNHPRTASIGADDLQTVGGISQVYEYCTMTASQVVELSMLLPGEPVVHLKDMIAMAMASMADRLGVSRDDLAVFFAAPDAAEVPETLRFNDS